MEEGDGVRVVGTVATFAEGQNSRCVAMDAGLAVASGAHSSCVSGWLRACQAARRSYRWWRPPTSGIATMSPSPGGMTGRGIGVSFSKPKWVRDFS
jgi:hypothetical protein